MFLNKTPRLPSSTKARFNAHTHIEPRKKSPDEAPGPPSPSEVLVFNTTHHGSGSTRAGHYNKSLPEVPDYEEIQRFMKESWDERIKKINDPKSNLRVLWIKSSAEEEREREQSSSSKPDSSCSKTKFDRSNPNPHAQAQNHPLLPKSSKSSPQHLNKTNKTT